jgi:thymidylate synthase
MGIRYDYGDLNDVVDLLARSPATRQAVLPVWFPEDTGAVHGERVPCSLFYHFIVRDQRLHVVYSIRSCDLFRHFRDDVYLTCRLGQWVLEQLRAKEASKYGGMWAGVQMGTLTMHITSLHIFEAELKKL